MKDVRNHPFVGIQGVPINALTYGFFGSLGKMSLPDVTQREQITGHPLDIRAGTRRNRSDFGRSPPMFGSLGGFSTKFCAIPDGPVRIYP